MDRKKFLKNACGLGFCACVGTALSTNNTASASETPASDWKEAFVKNRMAKLIDLMDETLDVDTKNNIIENVGRDCAKDLKLAEKYKGNPEGFLEEIHRKWGENHTYDKEKGIIKIETPERDCVCPLVDSKKISPTMCQCSVGWQAQTYEIIFGKKVEASCVESVVRGSKRCAFEIKV